MDKPQKDRLSQPRRVVGMDAHPDIYSAGILKGSDSATASVERIIDQAPLVELEAWVRRYLRKGDTVVLEASANSFAIAERLYEMPLGLKVVIIESYQAGQVGEAYCSNDRLCAVKTARAYLTGLTKTVWQPDEKTRTRREILSAHQDAVAASTRGKNHIRCYLNEHCVRLPRGFRLCHELALNRVLKMRDWNEQQRLLLQLRFDELDRAEKSRKQLRAVMAKEVLDNPQILKLVRLMGVRHIVAFAVAAVIGDIDRFANPKKLVAYLGLSPSSVRSGRSIRKSSSLAHTGRRDLRGLLSNVAQNALNRSSHPLHKWGWKLVLRKSHRNVAVIAVARKMTVAIWYLLKGYYTPLAQKDNIGSIRERINKLATALGLSKIKARGYKTKREFIEKKMEELYAIT